MFDRQRNPGRLNGALAWLAVAILASVGAGPAQAATTLTIATSGEPWKDPSISTTGPKLSVDARPAGGLNLGWSTTAAGVVGVTWQVVKSADPTKVVARGRAALPQVSAPGTTHWILVPDLFLAPNATATATEYQISVTPYNVKKLAADMASPSVSVTQGKTTNTGFNFGPTAAFPTLDLESYFPDYGQTPQTQLFHEVGTVTLRIRNAGTVPTNKVRLSISDSNVVMIQDGPLITIPSLAPGTALAKTVSVHLKGMLPPAQSQMPDEQQYMGWGQLNAEHCGVDLRALMDVDPVPGQQMPANDHSEVELYKGIGSSTNVALIKNEVPLCDGKQCVRMSDVAASIRKQLDKKVVGYAFFLAGCSIRSEAYGLARVPNLAFTPSTKMQVASVSKVITALAAVRVIAKYQKINPNLKKGLDTPIGGFLPTWNWGSEYMNEIGAITFRQLLSQTSGIMNYGDFDLTYDNLKQFFSQQVHVGKGTCGDPSNKSVTSVDPAIVTDKSQACYSNINFAIFRILLPRIAGYAKDDPDDYAKIYAQLVRENVFAPVGVTDADCAPPAGKPYAYAYKFPGGDGKDFGDLSLKCGGEGWYVSVEDLGKVLLSLNGADGRILTETQFQNMELDPAVHAVGWDCTIIGCSSSPGVRWLEKNGLLENESRKNNSTIAIFGSSNKDPNPADKGLLSPPRPYIPGAVGVLFIDSDIANAPDTDVSSILAKAFTDSSKPEE